MKYLRISAKVESRIEEMKRSGRSAASLAQKALDILDCIKSGDMLRWDQSSRMVTKYGEKRIRGCRKFDLGAGFRLITIHRGEAIYVPFIGSHDECRRWLEINSKLKDIPESDGSMARIDHGDDDAGFWFDDDGSDKGTDEDEWLRPVSDEELRTVFSGLVDGLK